MPAAPQLSWPALLRRPRGTRGATHQLYRATHAGGARFAWYARTYLEALARARSAPGAAGPIVQLAPVEFGVWCGHA